MEPDELIDAAVGMVGDCGDAAFLVTMDGTIVAWNERATEFFGVAPWHACQKDCATVVRAFTPSGDVVCTPDCPVRARAGHAIVTPEIRVNVLVDDVPSNVRHAHVHHLPIVHEDAGPLAILHVIGREPD